MLPDILDSHTSEVGLAEIHVYCQYVVLLLYLKLQPDLYLLHRNFHIGPTRSTTDERGAVETLLRVRL